MGEAETPEVFQLIAAGRFAELRAKCEELELSPPEPTPDAEANHVEQEGLRCAVHLLAYLLEGQLDAARFLWKRTAAPLQQHVQAQAAHRVLSARWRRQYAESFAQLSAGPWDARLQPLVTEVVRRSREELLDKIAIAYKVVSLSHLASVLGLDAVSAKAACETRGWALDTDGHVAPTASKSGEDLIKMGEAQLDRLSQYMAHLEQTGCKI
ncbi:unnamed protein product [Cladocopium goreaui]|uniref:COP9 signalosome complex subunit 8 n=1 Tax=Cladocopium goreaui TaxID=2562237 RepID=A0A9P1FW21_9DINO|nr:unnamed protein product [Cladocopium goreaui]